MDRRIEILPVAQEGIQDLIQRFRSLVPAVAEEAHPLCLAALELRLASQADAGIQSHVACSQWRDLTRPVLSSLYKIFLEVVAARDELTLSGDEQNDFSPSSFRNHLQGALAEIESWLHHWSDPWNRRIPKPTAAAIDPSPCSSGQVNPLIRFAPRDRSRSRRSMAEVGRIRFENPSGATLTGPLYLTASPDDGFFVSFFTSGHVVEISSRGDLIRTIGSGSPPFCGPAGLVVDQRRRLWVAEAVAGRIRVLDPPYSGPGQILPLRDGAVTLKWPVGLCSWTGAVLVADPRGNQLVRIDLDGDSDVLLARSGRGAGEIRHPNSLCREARDTTCVWLVDKLNHRLQLFDSELNVIGELGRCGFGNGELFYPLALGVFPDGTLVVSQQGAPWAVKLFSRSGVETESLLLDYSPAGILIHSGRIYVAAMNDNTVRVYERA
jgi:hypothetical protein